jgi:hypothetical protein
MAGLVGTYNYTYYGTYGTADTQNRQIQFVRSRVAPNSINARVFILSPQKVLGDQTCTVAGDQILVQLSSSFDSSTELKLNPSRFLSQLSIEDQNEILSSFSQRSVIIISKDNLGGYEEVTQVNIYNY